MTVRLVNGTSYQTKPGSNVVFHLGKAEFIDIHGDIHSVMLLGLLQIEP